MRRFTACLLSIAVLTASLPAAAQTNESVAKAAVRDGVREIRDIAQQGRITQGWSGIVTGTIMGGLSTWLLIDGITSDNTSRTVVGAAFGIVSVSSVTQAVYTLSNISAMEQTSQLLLDNESTLATSGYVFLAHEAERARQARTLGGILSVTSGLTSGLLLIPILTDDSDESLIGLSDTWWVVIIGSTAALSVYGGISDLFTESSPERIFRQVQTIVGGQSVAWSISPGAVSDGRSVGPGLALEGRF